MSAHPTRSPLEHEKPASRRSKRRQVFEHVLAEIESGKRKHGERIPSEAELVLQFSSSRPTVARALRDLQNLGLVERKVGSGTYVRKTRKQSESWRFGLLIPGLGSTGIPIVLLDRDIVAFPQRSRFDLVGIDNRRAGYLVADRFIRHGCRRIDFLVRPTSDPS